MRARRSGTLVAALAVLAAAAAAAGAEERKLHLAWIDPTGLAPRAYPAIVSESRKALRDLGALLEWTAAKQGAVLGPESLAVIAIQTNPDTLGAGRHVMGATPEGRRRPPAVWVYPDQVAWALGLDVARRGSWGKIAEAGFARALGRVVSHEVAHALGARTHTRSGLMAAVLDRRALTASSLRLDAVTAAALRGILDGGARVAAGPRADAPIGDRLLHLGPELPNGPALDSNR